MSSTPPFLSCGTLTVRNRALAFRPVRLQYWPVERRGRKCSPHWLPCMLVRKDPETAPLCPQYGDAMRLARTLPPVRSLSGLVAEPTFIVSVSGLRGFILVVEDGEVDAYSQSAHLLGVFVDRIDAAEAVLRCGVHIGRLNH
jgi:hypothetical protein